MPPIRGEAAWGVTDPDGMWQLDSGGRLEAWWDVDGVRQSRILADNV